MLSARTGVSLESSSNNISFKSSETKLHLSNAQILSLVSHQIKFNNKIQKLNKIGVECIISHRYSEALNHLQEAERILQYAASCGKTIDRFLITTTLQNQACAYQRIWDIERSSDYLEALLQNHRACLGTLPTYSPENLNQADSLASITLSNFISNRIDGVFHWLQYSALSSQIGRHQTAIDAVKEGINMLKSVCNECSKFQKQVKGKISPLMEDLLKGFDIKGSKPKAVLLETKASLSLNSISSKKYSFSLKMINQFTIGQVLQVSTLTVAEAKQKNSLEQQISPLGLIYKFLYLSICYFVLSTQNRLLTNQKYPEKVKNQAKEKELKRSQGYHLWAIKVVAGVIGNQSEYLIHITESFKKHYGIDIFSQQIHHHDFSSLEIDCPRNETKPAGKCVKKKKRKNTQPTLLTTETTNLFNNAKIVNSSKPKSIEKSKKHLKSKSSQKVHGKEKLCSKDETHKNKKSSEKGSMKLKPCKKSLKTIHLIQEKKKSVQKKNSLSSSHPKFSHFTVPTNPSSTHEINEEYFGVYSQNDLSNNTSQKYSQKSTQRKLCSCCSTPLTQKKPLNDIKFPKKAQ